MKAVVQILKVNDVRTGTKDGRQWEMQDAECVLLSDTGMPEQVGVLMVPKELRGKVTPGVYTGSFALNSSLRDRRIEAVLTGLVELPPDYFKRHAPQPAQPLAKP
ncbi:MAG: hypothetical protein QM581_08290 [Pseudomonas sp.]